MITMKKITGLIELSNLVSQKKMNNE